MHPRTRFTFAGEQGAVSLYLLGIDEDGRMVLSVRSRTVINPCSTFPVGRELLLVAKQKKKKKAGPMTTHNMRVHAFEFGFYRTLRDFEQRATQAVRPKAVHTGILTCEISPCI